MVFIHHCTRTVIIKLYFVKIEHALPFSHEVWDYGKPQTDLINRVIN